METPRTHFAFGGYTIHETADTIDFHYTVGHAGRPIDFVEKLIIPGLSAQRTRIPDALLKNILDPLLLLLGISYWKLYCPSDIDVHSVVLTREQAKFWNTVYTKGMGEFFYKNQIDYRNLIHFPYSDTTISAPVEIKVPDRSLVQLGGGKDSIVTSELLKEAEKDFSLICVDAHDIHRTVAQKIGKPLISVERRIDPHLYEWNKQSGTYNGHIPISAVYALVDLLMAALHGYTYIITSNEESANHGNVAYLGQEINHQWSKTFEFETLFQAYVTSFITPSITYFSLLRPIKEIKIVALFAKYEQYFHLFTSCNTNFRRTVSSAVPRWCGKCPKCAFVFLLLSGFLPKQKLIGIFGKNLYEDNLLMSTFRELLGLVGTKPFECVGTPEECRYALYLASQTGEYETDALFLTLRKELSAEWGKIGGTRNGLFSISPKHRIPSEFQTILTKL